MTPLVILATPTIDGKLPVEYVKTLSQVLQSQLANIYEIYPMFISGDSLLIRARNDLFKAAYRDMQAEELIFIDADMAWTLDGLMRLLSAPADLVGAAYRQKTESIKFVVKSSNRIIPDSNGLAEVDGLGCGFLRISKRAMQILWDSTRKYNDPDKGETAAIFETSITDTGVVGEDTSLCNKWKAAGGRW